MFDKGGQEHHLYSVDGETESRCCNKSTRKPGVLFWHCGDLLMMSQPPFGVFTRSVCGVVQSGLLGTSGCATTRELS